MKHYSFDPLKYMLNIIRAHVDSKAHIFRHPHEEHAYIRYRQYEGSRIVLHGKLLYKRCDKILTKEDARRICKELSEE